MPKGKFCVRSGFRCLPARDMACQNAGPSRPAIQKSGAKEPDIVRSYRRNGREKIENENSCRSAQMARRPASVTVQRPGTPHNMARHKKKNGSTMPEDQMKAAAAVEAAASAGSHFGREDLRMQPGCRHGEVRGIHLCHHGHRGSRQSCSQGSASRHRYLVACQPAGLIAMHIVVGE